MIGIQKINNKKDDQQRIETLLLELELKSDIETIKYDLIFISKLLSDSISFNQIRIADLFCRIISKIKEAEVTDDIKDIILDAFKNIYTVPITNFNKGSSCILHLLSVLYKTREIQDSVQINQLIDSGFIDLLDDLESVSILFNLYDENQIKIFPIENFLCKILDTHNLIEEINNPRTIKALMIALQIFDKKNYPDQITEIFKIVKKYKLEFINYIRNGAIHCYDNWKDNYERNGTLVLYDEKRQKILIRNQKKNYFEENDLCKVYNLSELHKEENANREIIAYYIEYDGVISIDESLNDEFLKNNNSTRIIEILSLIFDYEYFNIFGPGQLFVKNNDVLPTNPFSFHDKYCFLDGKISSNKYVNKYLIDRYGLLRIAGQGINYINIGTLVTLQEKNRFNIKGTNFENEIRSYTDLLIYWLRTCPDKIQCMNSFMSELDKQLSFLKKIEDFFAKNYINEFLLPIVIPNEIITELVQSSEITQEQLSTCEIKNDFFNDKHTILINGNDYSDFTLQNFDGENVNLDEGSYPVLLREDERKIIFDKSISLYIALLDNIKLWNTKLLSFEKVEKVTENNIIIFVKYMKMFNQSFQKIHDRIPLNSIVRYRLAYHILLIKLPPDNYQNWIDLINKHNLVDFSKFKGKKHLVNENGVLYIPKNRSRDHGTLKNIYNDYLLDHDDRNQIDLFDPSINFNSGHYFINGEMIKKICFVFDLIQNGTSSLGTIKHYFEDNIQGGDNSYLELQCKYPDGKREIKLKEIIEKNDINKQGVKVKTTVLSLYGAENGLNKIKEYFESKNINYEERTPEILLEKIITDEDNKLIDKLYPPRIRGKIYENCYPCIREYNQPKLNIMADELLDIEKIYALFYRK